MQAGMQECVSRMKDIDAYRHGYKETNIERSDCKIDIYKSGILYFCIYV